jgi:hypothetical protein
MIGSFDNGAALVTEAVLAAFNQQHEDVQPTITAPVLRFGNRCFTLRHPIEVEVALKSGMWVYKSSVFGIESVGGSKYEAQESFVEDFAALFDHLAHEADEGLTPEATRLKNAFLDIVTSVATYPV